MKTTLVIFVFFLPKLARLRRLFEALCHNWKSLCTRVEKDSEGRIRRRPSVLYELGFTKNWGEGRTYNLFSHMKVPDIMKLQMT